MSWAGHGARLGERRAVYRVVIGKHEVKMTLGNIGTFWRVTLQRISKNGLGGRGLDLSGSGYGAVIATCV
jgi:hypothetical protein